MAFNTNTDFVINSDYDESYASIYVISSSLVGTFYLRLTSPYDTSHFMEE